jgi:hypothetical protein
MSITEAPDHLNAGRQQSREPVQRTRFDGCRTAWILIGKVFRCWCEDSHWKGKLRSAPMAKQTQIT